MYSTYQLQLPIFHAMCMILPLNLFFYINTFWEVDIVIVKDGLIVLKQGFIYYLLPLNIVFLLYSIYMVKSVSENHHFKSL